VPIGDKIVMFYWQGGNPPFRMGQDGVTDKMQVFAYGALTGKCSGSSRKRVRPALAVPAW